ncbi:MAG: LacI family DNA-binding transcriptional regulator [Deltaproteobacteria bacterium]|nr:LacI family DNA-binding transcriptional regulator [Deltaproteobacteria bacterium]
MVTIKDVASAAGVSTATVSRVIADKPHVSDAVREKVMAAVEQLGYRPNLVAQNLRAQQSKILGLIVSDIQNPFFRHISRAVEDTAHENGYSVILCNTDENPDKEKMYLQLMQDQNTAGIILSPTKRASREFERILKLNIPLAVIDRRVADFDIDNIVTDNLFLAEKITSHFCENGYQRIAGLFGDSSTTGIERHQGYLSALKKAGRNALKELVRFIAPRELTGYEAARDLLELAQPPDAIFTSNSLLAVGVLLAIKEKNLSIPGQIGLATFDDTSWAKLVTPSITVVDQPAYEIGQTATEMLIKRIKDPSRSARKVILKGHLIVRQSSVRP